MHREKEVSMRNKLKIFKILFGVTFFVLVAFFVVPQKQKVYAEDLYFDEDGNLYYHVMERKATSGIKYVVIGWTLKKYPTEINEAGQMSVRIPRPYVTYNIENKDNPEFFDSYVIIGKEHILNGIESASKEWKESLESYGGKVYIDGIFTINEYGDKQGAISEKGDITGEVYLECEGISNAREWRDKSAFPKYFNMSVYFPVTMTEPESEDIIDSTEDVNMTGNVLVSSLCGSNEQGQEKYDVDKGIPSGENVYVYGEADKYYYEVAFEKVTGIRKCVVEYTCPYDLYWTDKIGEEHHEEQTVKEYKIVDKDFCYYRVKDVSVYTLDSVKISGSDIEDREVEIDLETKEDILTIQSHEDTRGKLSKTAVTLEKQVIHSENHYRPDIKKIDMSAYTPEITYEVRNDYVAIGETVIVSDEYKESDCTGNINMEGLETTEKATIYEKDIVIDKNAKNGTKDDWKVEYTYVCGDKIKVVESDLNDINIHTPVCCDATVTAAKKYNMSVEPKANQIVLTSDFKISFSGEGSHLDIKGYGKKDYKKYAKNMAIMADFPLVINGDRYEKNTWIYADKTEIMAYVPEDVKTGDYKVSVAAISNNCEDDITYEEMEEQGILADNANLLETQYVAMDTMEISIIGTIYEFNMDDEYFVGSKIGFHKSVEEGKKSMPMVLEFGKTYECKVTSNGFGADESDYIKADLKYFIEKDGKREEVDVYVNTDRNILDDISFDKAPDCILWTGDGKSEDDENTYNWTSSFGIDGQIVVMPKNIKPQNEEIIKKYAIRNNEVIVNSEIKGYKEDVCVYSYINEENYKNGYCNMWKTEQDFSRNDCYDGDLAVINIPKEVYGDYEVVGTH